MLSARDADHDLIQVPFVPGCRKTSPDLIGKALPELQSPLPYGLMTDQNASGRQHLLDHAQAERKPEIQPDSMADHFGREAMTGIARVTGRFHTPLMLL